MRFRDMLSLPLAALWQQKGRTLLTTLGVVFGAFVLAASLSIGAGVRQTIDRESHRVDIARRVEVFPKWNPANPETNPEATKVEGNVSEARRQRLRLALAETAQQANPAQVRTELNRDRLRQLATIPHVAQVVPFIKHYGYAVLGDQTSGASIVSARPDDEAGPKRIVAGRYFVTPHEPSAILTEYLAYRLGYRDDDAVNGLIGKPLRLEFRVTKAATGGFALFLVGRQPQGSLLERSALDKLSARLPFAIDRFGLTPPEVNALRTALRDATPPVTTVTSFEFTIVGVIHSATPEDRNSDRSPLNNDFDVILPYETATDVFFDRPNQPASGVPQAMLLADTEENVKAVVASARAQGVEARAATEFIERERLIYLLIFGGMTCVAAVALLVSAMGITNTMLMSVLERTREIGIMKAVGADGRHLQLFFLIEGTVIGLFGSITGLLLAWLASIPGDAWVRSMVLREIKVDLKSTIFVFPIWIIAVVLFFTTMVTTFAALYPARRASRIDPVSALRHE